MKPTIMLLAALILAAPVFAQNAAPLNVATDTGLRVWPDSGQIDQIKLMSQINEAKRSNKYGYSRT